MLGKPSLNSSPEVQMKTDKRNPPISGRYKLTVEHLGKTIFDGIDYYSQDSGWNFDIPKFASYTWSYNAK